MQGNSYGDHVIGSWLAPKLDLLSK